MSITSPERSVFTANSEGKKYEPVLQGINSKRVNRSPNSQSKRSRSPGNLDDFSLPEIIDDSEKLQQIIVSVQQHKVYLDDKKDIQVKRQDQIKFEIEKAQDEIVEEYLAQKNIAKDQESVKEGGQKLEKDIQTLKNDLFSLKKKLRQQSQQVMKEIQEFEILVEQGQQKIKLISNKAQKDSKKEQNLLQKQADLIDSLAQANVEKTQEAKDLNETLIDRRVKKKLGNDDLNKSLISLKRSFGL